MAELLAVQLARDHDSAFVEIDRLNSPPEVTIRDGLYYIADGDGPLCTGCYDVRNKLVRVLDLGASFRLMAKWRCLECTAKYR